MHISIFLAWYDFWVGVFVDVKKKKIYICPLPCVVVCIQWDVSYFVAHEGETEGARYTMPNLNWIYLPISKLINKVRRRP